MSKKAPKKKASPVANGTPAAPTDARVVQQMRVHEIVGGSSANDDKDKKYSPRTEAHIKKLTDVLEFYAYSRSDISALVRRCHYDEQQIQNAVANIIEDRANSEQKEWGVVKTKKQAKAQTPVLPPEPTSRWTHKAAQQPADARCDARVAQQMRVLETVGADKDDKDDKQYSPRTEGHIKQLSDVLDFFGYSRGDIVALVRRCHYDEQQIQIAVANIIEDKANHEQTQWGEVKSKKQLKEEKKIKEEEEKLEQDRVERELERQRKESERRSQKDYDRSHNRGRGRGGRGRGDGASRQHDNATTDAVSGSALPPDPAILFAGSKPPDKNEKNKDDWWDGFVSNWAEWDNKDDGTSGQGNDARWENGKDWDWKHGGWNDDNWEGNHSGGNKGDDNWWSGDWEQAGAGNSESNAGSQSTRGKRGQKEPRANTQKKETAEIWDMPDISAAGNEGGLDQWALGDIRVHERRVAGADAPELGGKMPLESGMRTVEQIEREQLGLTPGADVMSASNGTLGKSQLDLLLQQAPETEANSTGHSNNTKGERGKGRGGKGKGKGGDRGDRGERSDRGEKGGDKGDRPDRSDRGDRGDRGADERAEKEKGERAERDKERLERIDRSDDPRRQPMEEVGENVTVRKHSSMGCAVISMRDPRVRDAILAAASETNISGMRVQMKPHHDKDTKAEVPTDIFVAWGHKEEKKNPLSERELAKHFDQKHIEITDVWRQEAEEKARQNEERVRQQKLLEEQQRQQAEQREREEQRRRFEEDLARRRQEEEQQRQVDAQRKLMEEQARRQEEQRRITRETQAKWINDLQGNWAHSGNMGAGNPVAGAASHDPRATLGAAGALSAANPAAAGGTGTSAAGGAQTHADTMTTASAASLNAAAAAYPPQAAAQWGAAQQWMQAMAYHHSQAGWQTSLAQRGIQQMHGAMSAMTPQQAQAAYYAYMEQQQRGQSAAAYAAQHAQHAQQSGYMNSSQQNAAFGYGAAAAYGRGERI